MATKKTATPKTPAQAAAKNTILQGVVTSAAMQKTVVVKVTRFVKNAKYKKFQTLTKKYKVHDENGVGKVGDKVKIVETRPISKDKHFKLVIE